MTPFVRGDDVILQGPSRPALRSSRSHPAPGHRYAWPFEHAVLAGKLLSDNTPVPCRTAYIADSEPEDYSELGAVSNHVVLELAQAASLVVVARHCAVSGLHGRALAKLPGQIREELPRELGSNAEAPYVAAQIEGPGLTYWQHPSRADDRIPPVDGARRVAAEGPADLGR